MAKKKKPLKKKVKSKKVAKKEEKDKYLEVIEKEELGIELDPRRQKFAAFYWDPTSTTHGNALQSALRAGFSREYAESITYQKPRWFTEILGKLDIMESVRRNIKLDLDLDPKIQAMGAFGPLFEYTEKKVKVKLKNGQTKIKIKKVQGNPIMVESNSRIKLRQDMTMFVAEKLDPEFKKREKGELDPTTVEIKQIIILNPNGDQFPYNQAGTKTIPSLPGSSQ